MKILLARIKGIFYSIVGLDWIHPPAGEWCDYNPIPIWIVEEENERQGKYNAIRTEVDGFVFASRREARRYSELKLLESAGEIKGLELQPVYPCEVNGQLVCKYIADFRYKLPSGREVVEDAKGVKTPLYRLKNKLVRALYDVAIVEV